METPNSSNADELLKKQIEKALEAERKLVLEFRNLLSLGQSPNQITATYRREFSLELWPILDDALAHAVSQNQSV